MLFGDGIIWKELNFPNKKLPWKCHSCWNDFLNSPLFMKVAKLLRKWRNWHLLLQVLLYVQTSRGQTKQGAACLSELMRNDRLVICPFLSQYRRWSLYVFMCDDVFCKSSSILGRWSRTSQWKAGPRDDSYKVFFRKSVYVILSMEMRNSFVTHQANDSLQNADHHQCSPSDRVCGPPSEWRQRKVCCPMRILVIDGILSNDVIPILTSYSVLFRGKKRWCEVKTLYAGNIWEWMWGFIIQHFLTKKPLCSRNTITGQDKAYGSWPIITSLNEAFFYIHIRLHLERAGEFQNIIGSWSWIKFPKGWSEKKVYGIRLLTRETENSAGTGEPVRQKKKREIGQERENTRETVEEESRETENTGLKLSFE